MIGYSIIKLIMFKASCSTHPECSTSLRVESLFR
jgi:hypothetical protein